MENQNNYIGYEYKNRVFDQTVENLIVDSYPCFGWQVERTTPLHSYKKEVELRFKRNRTIINKAELTRLQRQFDASVSEILEYERSKNTHALLVALTIGLIGTAMMAGSVFSYLAGKIIYMVLLAIPGFLGWILPYFSYRETYKRKTQQINPLIEKKYDELALICEKANQLLGR